MAIRINAAPAATNDSYTFSENGSLSVALNVRSNDGKSSTRPLYSLDNGQSADLATADPVSDASSTLDRSALGAAIWINADGTVGYSTAPIAARVESLAPGETLQDSFLYATRQQNGSLLWSTVRVTITGANDAPVARNDSASLSEDSLAKGTVATNDGDVDNGAILSFAANSSAAGFAMAADGSWTLDASHQAYQDLAEGEARQVVVNYTVTDQYGASGAAALTLTVTGTNDGPVAAEAGAVAHEDASVSGRVVATDADRGDSLTYALVGDAPAGLTFADDGSWSFDASNAAYQSLAAGETQDVVVSYSATDKAGAKGVSTLTITVTGENDAPAALAASAEVAEDETVAGQLAADDADQGARLTYAVAKGVPEGFSLAADGSWTFDANQVEYQSLAEGESAGIMVTYRVTDEHGASSLSTLALTVTGANDAPVTTSHAAEVTEGGSVSGQLIALDQDNGARLSFAVVGEAPAGLSFAEDGGWTFDAANEAYQGLAAGEIRIVQVPFSVTDEQGATATSFMVIAVTGTDDRPMLTGNPPELPPATEDTAYVVTQEQLLAGWVDPDGDPLFASNLGATNATVTSNTDGSFTITPDADFSGELQLSYEVSGGMAIVAAQRSLTVAPVNDPATFSGTDTGQVTEDGGQSSISGDLDAFDVDNEYDSWTVVTSPTLSDQGYGSFVIDSAGRWTYTLDNGHSAVDGLATGETLTDSFTVRSADGTEHSVGIVINGATDFTYVPPPVSTASDPNDHDLLRSDQTRSSTLFNFYGTGANEVLDGSNGNDVMRGQGGADVIYGHGGNDRLLGELDTGSQPPADGDAGNDTLYGQAGNDFLAGGLGSDTLYGGSGTDELHGNNSLGSNPESVGNWLYGGSGNDRLYGDGGDDVLVGGTGADWLTGRGGSDLFVFTSAADTGDWIFDFQAGADKLDLSALGLDPANFVGALAAAGMVGPGEVGYMVVMGGSQTDTIIYVDTDGAMGADLEIRLIGTSQFGPSDIVW